MKYFRKDTLAQYLIEFMLLFTIVLCFIAQSIYYGRQLSNQTLDHISFYSAFNIVGLSDAFGTGDINRIGEAVKWNPYPPLHTATQAIFAALCGRNIMLMSMLANLPYLVMLLLFGYLLGRMLMDRKTGLLFAVFISMIPLVQGTFSNVSLDFPLMGLMSMNIYILIRSNLFSDRKWSILFGLSVGWGMMIKETYLLYIIGPLLYCLTDVIIKYRHSGNKKTLLNIFISTVIVFFMIFPYYCVPGYGNTILFQGPLMEKMGPEWYSKDNLIFFTMGLYSNQLTPPIFMAFLVGLWYFLKRPSSTFKYVLIVWILLPNLYVYFMPHWKTTRYLMPVLPALVLISALGARRLLEIKYGKVVVIMILISGIGQYYMINYVTNRYVSYEHGNTRSIFEYYHYTAVNRPYYEKKETSRIKKSIYEVINKEIASSLSKNWIRIFYPCYADQYWDCREMPVYQWFQKNVRIYNTEICRGIEDLNLINTVWAEKDQYDFIIFTLERSKADKLERAYLPFGALLESVVARIGKDSVAGIKNIDMSQVESSWINLTKYFGVHKKIYEDEKFAVYIYKKQ